jgi:hypothetical protein
MILIFYFLVANDNETALETLYQLSYVIKVRLIVGSLIGEGQ